MKPTPALGAIAAGLQLLTGCGGGEPAGPPPPAIVVTTIEITPTAPSLVAPDTVRLRATVKDQNGTVQVGQDLGVANNGTLATLGGGGGQVGRFLQVVDNRALSTAAALAWAGTFSVAGSVS